MEKDGYGISAFATTVRVCSAFAIFPLIFVGNLESVAALLLFNIEELRCGEISHDLTLP